MFHSYNVIILTETWLTPDILNTELGLLNFHVYRYDRFPLTSSHKQDGGVFIAVRASLKSSPVHVDINYVEQLFVILTISSFKLLVGVVYLPPRSPYPIYEAHTSTVETLLSSINPSSILLCGDYNLPHINWVNDITSLIFTATGNFSAVSSLLVDSFSFLNFFRHNQVKNSHGN